MSVYESHFVKTKVLHMYRLQKTWTNNRPQGSTQEEAASAANIRLKLKFKEAYNSLYHRFKHMAAW